MHVKRAWGSTDRFRQLKVEIEGFASSNEWHSRLVSGGAFAELWRRILGKFNLKFSSDDKVGGWGFACVREFDDVGRVRPISKSHCSNISNPCPSCGDFRIRTLLSYAKRLPYKESLKNAYRGIDASKYNQPKSKFLGYIQLLIKALLISVLMIVVGCFPAHLFVEHGFGERRVGLGFLFYGRTSLLWE